MADGFGPPVLLILPTGGGCVQYAVCGALLPVMLILQVVVEHGEVLLGGVGSLPTAWRSSNDVQSWHSATSLVTYRHSQFDRQKLEIG